MPLGRVRIAGTEFRVLANPETFSVDLTARNSLWAWFYSRCVRPIGGLVRKLLGERIPVTVSASDAKDIVEYRGKSVIRVPANAPESATEIARRASEHDWYHTLDLGHGIITPGAFDHSPIVQHYQLPESLSGKRVLDIACFDGFWALEFERRGADEVVAADIRTARELDLPAPVREKMSEEELDREMGRGFELVREVRGSKVRKIHCNVYDLNPEIAGKFDIVHIGDVLLHLQNPFRALERVRSVTRGYALISDIFDPNLDRLGRFPNIEYRGGLEDCVWWYFGLDALEKMIRDAGFRNVELVTKFRYGMRGHRQQMWHAIFRASD